MKAELLEAVIHFADEAHGEQMRKYTPERYIVHPVRVMQICQQYTHEPAVLTAALLHDVLEDTAVTEEMIRVFLSTRLDHDDTQKALRYIVELTDIYTKKKFPRMNRRTRKLKEAQRLGNVSEEAQTIKYADIMDNAVNIVQHDLDFGYVYLKESETILQHMKRGNPILYDRVWHTIGECREKVRKV